MIALRGVRVEIGRRALLQGIDATIGAGEMVAIAGPNGIGKTTLMRAIAGLHRASAGNIAIDGTDVASLSVVERALRIGFVTADEVLLDALTVSDVVAIGRSPHHRWWEWQPREEDAAAVACALSDVRMTSLAQRLFSTLSSGEKQRVWIALGLAQETPVLLLDEPTSHLDVRVAHEILALLRQLARAGKTIVCVLHDLNDAAAYADRIALLGDGRLLTIAPPDAVLESDLLERAYGIAMERVRLHDGSLRVFAAASPRT